MFGVLRTLTTRGIRDDDGGRFMKARLLLFCMAAATATAAEPKRPAPAPGDVAPDLTAVEKSAVMKVARGLLNALWSGGNPDDIPGATLRERRFPVSVTLRAGGVTLG